MLAFTQTRFGTKDDDLECVCAHRVATTVASGRATRGTTAATHFRAQAEGVQLIWAPEDVEDPPLAADGEAR